MIAEAGACPLCVPSPQATCAHQLMTSRVARRYGRLYLCRRCAARSGANRRYQRTPFPQKRGTRRHLNQGMRLHHERSSTLVVLRMTYNPGISLQRTVILQCITKQSLHNCPSKGEFMMLSASGVISGSVIVLQANCIDSTAEAEAVFAGEVNKLRAEKIKPKEQLTLEPYERDHAVVVGVYRYVTYWSLNVIT